MEERKRYRNIAEGLWDVSTKKKELKDMKITIELNEEELKGLIFGKEEPKNQPDARFGYDILYESRYIADCILEDMKDIAQKYGFVSVADFKDLSSILTGKEILVKNIDGGMGWTLDMICTKAHIIRMRNGYALGLPEPLFIE